MVVMSYEKELAELRKNWKKSTDKYEEAIEYGFVVDAAMRSHDVMEIERQIYVYEQATKADEYEAKAKAWDKLSMSIRECNKEIELKGGLNAMFRTSKKGQIVQRYIDCFESGESDELRE